MGSKIFWTPPDHFGPTKHTEKSPSLSLKQSLTFSELFCTRKMPDLQDDYKESIHENALKVLVGYLVVKTAIVPFFDLYGERVKLRRERNLEGRSLASKLLMT